MDTRLHLQLGQNGTKALVRKYGEQLVRVRYRYSSQTQQPHKTVELIEETVPWSPQGGREARLIQRAADESVFVKIAYDEWGLRQQGVLAARRESMVTALWQSIPFGIAPKDRGRYIDMDGYISSIRYISSTWR